MENVTRRTNEELAELIQKGHTELYPELWDNVSDLINQLAWQRYSAIRKDSGSIVSNEDFAQSGYLALVEAVRYYEPGGEYKFTTYLSKCLKTAFAETGGWRTSKIDAADNAFSLDAPISDDGEETFLDFLPDTRDDIQDADEQIWLEELRRSLDRAVAALGPKYSEVIYRRYVRRESLKAISEDAGVTQEMVRQWERSRYHKLRGNRDLRRFMDDLTDFYARVGKRSFNTTRTSAVELIAIKREALEQRFKDSLINASLDIM